MQQKVMDRKNVQKVLKLGKIEGKNTSFQNGPTLKVGKNVKITIKTFKYGYQDVHIHFMHCF